MAFLDKTGLQTLTNKLVQGDAIKVASHRGKNVKEVIDNIQRECENVALPNTMTLENRVNEFKAGQSRDIDVSGDVEEGKIEVELQGKTWQNVVHGKKSVQSNIFTIENGKYVFNNNATRSGGIIFSLICKPNTTYTLIINFLECALGDNTIYIDGHSAYLATINKNLPKTKGTHAISFVTKDDVTDKKMKLAILSSSTSKLVIDENIIVLEGDHTQTPVEELPKCFEGIKSSFEDGIVDVEVQGKNLFNKTIDEIELENEALLEKIDEKEFNLSFVEGKLSRGIFKKLIGTGKKQTLSIDTKFIQGQYGNSLSVVIREANFGISYAYYKIPNNSQYTRARMSFIVPKGQEYWILLYKTLQTDPSCKVGFRNIQIDNYCSNVEYEPYYKKKISFNIGEPLRSLPNGVCDEIRNNNGQWELVRRIGKVVLDGSSSTEYAYLTHEKTLRFSIFLRAELELLKPKTASHGICDRIPYMHGNSDDVFHCRFDGSSPYGNLIIWIEKSKLESENPTGLKKWLQSNPTTFYYQLAEPTITPIEPIEFNISQGSTINISSDISPTSTHKVILNRAGQIEQGIELIANLKSRVNELENIYDSNLIATQYKLDNLKLNYELEREED